MNHGFHSQTVTAECQIAFVAKSKQRTHDTQSARKWKVKDKEEGRNTVIDRSVKSSTLILHKNSDIPMDCQHFLSFNSPTNTLISSVTSSRPAFTFRAASLLRFDFLKRNQNTKSIHKQLFRAHSGNKSNHKFNQNCAFGMNRKNVF